jgi:Zn-dependent alcohol dehydrogenase
MTTTMRAAQISRPGGAWELVERMAPEPRAGHMCVQVEACGICHSDVLVKDGLWPGLAYPRVPGHEIAGRIDAVGDHVTARKPGQRVGVGWHGGHCFVCEQCRRGDFAVYGIGGLGHLGVQYARWMGFETVAITRGRDKEPLARQQGAHHYIDATAQEAVAELQKLGGARDSGDRAARAGDSRIDRRTLARRHPVGAGRAGGAVGDPCDVAHQWQAVGGRLVCRHRGGCAGQTASKFPLRWWIMNSTVFAYIGWTHSLDRVAMG